MAQCINKSEVEYGQLLEMTGLMPAELDMYIGEYYSENGKCPTVDRFLRSSNTSAAFVKEYNLKKCGKGWIAQDDRPIDIRLINSKYRDIEVSTIESTISPTLYVVKPRAILNRQLETEPNYLLPTISQQVQELEPYQQLPDGSFIYINGNNIYRTNCKVTSPLLLTNYPVFQSLYEATSSTVSTSYDTEVINTINNNKGKLQHNQPITIHSTQPLPSKIKLFSVFNYPNFEYSNVIGDRDFYVRSDGVIQVNSSAIQNELDLETILLQAQGFNEKQISTILGCLHQFDTYEVIREGNDTYKIQKAKEVTQDVNSIINEFKPKQETVTQNQLEKILDRLENLYGIPFIRVTTKQLNSSEFKDIIPNAAGTNAFIYNGQIYINTDNARSDAPIHELSHILLGALRVTNPELYYAIVQSVEQLPDYQKQLSKYPNRTRQDANEEIFVDLFAKHYTQGWDLGLDANILSNVEYEIEHNIDSGIFPNKSTTTMSLSDIMGKSFEEIMDTFGTAIDRDTMIKAYSQDTAYAREISNLKEELLKRKELEEYCSDGKHHSQSTARRFRRYHDSEVLEPENNKHEFDNMDQFISEYKRTYIQDNIPDQEYHDSSIPSQNRRNIEELYNNYINNI